MGKCLLLIAELAALAFSAPQKEVPSSPEDFIGDDVPISITVPFEVFINGKVWDGHGFGWHILEYADTKSAIWLGVPGQGMYILSLDRYASGFHRAGTIHANIIRFRAGDDQLEIRMRDAIVDSDKTWNLYMLHRPDMEMKGPLMGVDRLGNCTLGFLR